MSSSPEEILKDIREANEQGILPTFPDVPRDRIEGISGVTWMPHTLRYRQGWCVRTSSLYPKVWEALLQQSTPEGMAEVLERFRGEMLSLLGKLADYSASLKLVECQEDAHLGPNGVACLRQVLDKLSTALHILQRIQANLEAKPDRFGWWRISEKAPTAENPDSILLLREATGLNVRPCRLFEVRSLPDLLKNYSHWMLLPEPENL